MLLSPIFTVAQDANNGFRDGLPSDAVVRRTESMEVNSRY